MMTLQIGEDDIAFIKLGANFKQLCLERTVWRTHNSTFAIGGVSCSKDSFVVHQTFVFQIKFCGKSPALRVAAKRYIPF